MSLPISKWPKLFLVGCGKFYVSREDFSERDFKKKAKQSVRTNNPYVFIICLKCMELMYIWYLTVSMFMKKSIEIYKKKVFLYLFIYIYMLEAVKHMLKVKKLANNSNNNNCMLIIYHFIIFWVYFFFKISFKSYNCIFYILLYIITWRCTVTLNIQTLFGASLKIVVQQSSCDTLFFFFFL